jgi:hypothetical protein
MAYPRDTMLREADEIVYPEEGYLGPNSPARQIGTAAEHIREPHICE